MQKSRSSLFLMELLFVILIFSVSSAICIQLFVKSLTLSKDASRLNAASNWCANAASILSSQHGSLDALAAQFPDGVLEDKTFTLALGADFKECPGQNGCYTLLVQSRTAKSGIQDTTISFYIDGQTDSFYSLDANYYTPKVI